MKITIKHLLSEEVTAEELRKLRSFKVSTILKVLQSLNTDVVIDINYEINEIVIGPTWLLRFKGFIEEINPMIAFEILGYYTPTAIKEFSRMSKVCKLFYALQLNKTKIINDVI